MNGSRKTILFSMFCVVGVQNRVVRLRFENISTTSLPATHFPNPTFQLQALANQII